MSTVERIELDGSYGDGKVIIEHGKSENPSGWLAVIFHGVHGCSTFEGDNKYGILGKMLLEAGVDVCLVESSRSRRDRHTFGDNRSLWAMSAFEGKTYFQDLYDQCSAMAFVTGNLQYPRICMWGFSLGGIHCLPMASGEYTGMLKNQGLEPPLFDHSRANALVLSGIGDSIRSEVSESLALPVIKSITYEIEASIQNSASLVKTPEVVFFYGGEDGTFSERSSRNLFDLIPAENKCFHIIRGSDHAFRNMCGKPSSRPLEIMVSTLAITHFLL